MTWYHATVSHIRRHRKKATGTCGESKGNWERRGAGVGGGEGEARGLDLLEAERELRRRCLVLRRSLAILVSSPTVCTTPHLVNFYTETFGMAAGVRGRGPTNSQGKCGSVGVMSVSGDGVTKAAATLKLQLAPSYILSELNLVPAALCCNAPCCHHGCKLLLQQ